MQINNISLHLSITIILKTCSASSSTKYLYMRVPCWCGTHRDLAANSAGCHIKSRTSNMQACTQIHGFTFCIVRLLVHNNLIHHPAEGKGDCRRMKTHWKESRTLRETIGKETNNNGAVVSRFKICVCYHWGLPPEQSLRFTLTITFDEQMYVGMLNTAYKSGSPLVMRGYDWDHDKHW